MMEIIKFNIWNNTVKFQLYSFEMLQKPCTNLKDTSRLLWHCGVWVTTTSEAQVDSNRESKFTFYKDVYYICSVSDVSNAVDLL